MRRGSQYLHHLAWRRLRHRASTLANLLQQSDLSETPNHGMKIHLIELAMMIRFLGEEFFHYQPLRLLAERDDYDTLSQQQFDGTFLAIDTYSVLLSGWTVASFFCSFPLILSVPSMIPFLFLSTFIFCFFFISFFLICFF